MRCDIAGSTVHLTYCLNIHPGETLAENELAIREHASRVRDLLGYDDPFGLGLRLSADATRELASPAALDRFRGAIRDAGMYVFTINGFPYSTFHGGVVKEHVYAPDWTTPERLEYTLGIGRVLAAFLPDGVNGSISTVPGTYRAWVTDETLPRMLANLMRIVDGLARIESQSGKRIALALEPEPDCVWDSVEDLVELFGKVLPEEVYPMLAEQRGCSLSDAGELVRRHLGICLDTCHQAVIWERPADALRKLLEADVPIAKIQVSAAPVASCDSASLDTMRSFVDPVYLHQTALRDGAGAVRRFPDLPQALQCAEMLPDTCELRTHFHIPLVVDSWKGIRSTAAQLDREFWELVRTSGVSHIEVETYSFDVLPEELRCEGVDRSIAAELAWTRDRLLA